jgi:MerR family transcriptional regulator, mercuric resistance operon regulatory protein
MSGMTISRLAGAAGVTVETIRFYQRIGLIQAPQKPSRGVRRYADEDVGRLRFIKRAQQLGFALTEVRHLLTLEHGQSCGAARTLAAQKLEVVDSRLADLTRMRNALNELIKRCDVRRGKVTCPIIATLHRGGGPRVS